jgi:hypothetical protein
MKTFLAAFVWLSATVFANPIADPAAAAEKTWERCLISAGEVSSTVSCAVGYRGVDPLVGPFHIAVPVILPDRLRGKEAESRELMQLRLEVGGKVHSPKYITFKDDRMLPEGAVIAECLFELGKIPGRSFAIVVTYEQPTINGKVLYLPQFEKGKNPEDFTEFSVSVFPAGGGLLGLESKHAQETTAFSTRITIKPVHHELIQVAYRLTEAAQRSD